MDNSAQPSSAPLHPRFEPHLPITEAEMNPNPDDNHNSSGKNTLLTLASLLVLAGIVGITLFLYIQNKLVKISDQANNTSNDSQRVKEIADTKVVGEKNIKLVAKYGAICKRFTSLKDALKEPEVACILDLSGNKLSTIPEEIYLLKNLNTLNLSNNSLSKFPLDLFKITSLISIDLRDNKISEIPTDLIIPERIQILKLENNELPSTLLNKYQR